MPKNDFDWLEAKYPTGKYHSAKGLNWFEFYIPELEVEVTFFMARTYGDSSEE